MGELVQEGHIRVLDAVDCWQQAVRIACEPLERNGYALPSLHRSLIANARYASEQGIVSPYVVLPQGAPAEVAVGNGVSVLVSRKPFHVAGSIESVRLLVLIVAVSAHDHLELLKRVASVLNDSERLQGILGAPCAHDVYLEFSGGEQ